MKSQYILSRGWCQLVSEFGRLSINRDLFTFFLANPTGISGLYIMLTELIERFPLLRGLLDFAFPPLCSGCGEFCEHPSSVCEKCLAQIEWFDKPFVLGEFGVAAWEEAALRDPGLLPLFAAGDYVDPLKRVIIDLKFKGVTSSVFLLAGKLAEIHEDEVRKLKPDILVPIPLHPSREHHRGYNQATLLADELAVLLEIPVREDLLLRIRKGRPQAKLSESKRAKNIKGVFAIDREYDSEGLNVILVDDVVTSGRTILEAKVTLERSGCTVVGCMAIAHGL